MVKKEKFPWQVIACALFVFIFTNLFSFFIFDHIPHINDEVAYLFQAKIFKSGRPFAPSSCVKESFDFTHIINNGKWYSQYPPGYPLLLALGLIFGTPWLINPLLAALSIVLFYYLGTELYSRRIGILAAFLGAISIWFLVMSSSMMSHTSCMFFCTLFLLFYFRSLRNPTAINGIIAGASLGMAILIRPHPGVFFAVPFLIYFGINFLKKPKTMLKNTIGLGLSLLLCFSIMLAYNHITNGHPLKMGYEVSHGDHGIGFGKAGYTDVEHSPFLGSSYLFNYLEELNGYLFGWPLSSLIVFLPLFFVAPPQKETRKADLLLASGFFTLFFSLYFYWGTYVLIGPRMIFESLPVIILLAARGLGDFPAMLVKIFKKMELKWANRITRAAVLIFIMYAFLIKLPIWIWPPDTEWYYHGFDNNYARVTPRIHNRLDSLEQNNSLILMKFLYHPVRYFPNGWWGSGFLYNDPDLKNKTIYAKFEEEKLPEIFECFPNRKVFLYYGTLKQGMLIPIHLKQNQIVYEQSIPPSQASRNSIAIIDNPLGFYTLYSQEFTDFMRHIYNQSANYSIDVAWLLEKAQEAFNQTQYHQAAFYLEAAMQIEKSPVIRYPNLSRLVQCYIKTGNIQEAQIIADRIDTDEATQYYNIIPEKGF